MARYTGAVCRQCRREGQKLFLKGDRCYSDKCAIDRRPFAPGQHGQARNKKLSEYGLQLREKQKARYAYGVLEKQFRRYYEEADRLPGKTGEALLQILETRLDNVIYRAGFASTRRQARQMVSHGHFLVNGKRVTIPSFRVSPLDIVDVAPKSLNLTPFIIARETWGEREVPGWLTVKPNRMRILVHQLPTREQITIDVNEQAVVELYSK